VFDESLLSEATETGQFLSPQRKKNSQSIVILRSAWKIKLTRGADSSGAAQIQEEKESSKTIKMVPYRRNEPRSLKAFLREEIQLRSFNHSERRPRKKLELKKGRDHSVGTTRNRISRKSEKKKKNRPHRKKKEPFATYVREHNVSKENLSGSGNSARKRGVKPPISRVDHIKEKGEKEKSDGVNNASAKKSA